MAKSCDIPNGELSEFDLPRVCVPNDAAAEAFSAHLLGGDAAMRRCGDAAPAVR